MQKSLSIKRNGGYHGNKSERHWYAQSRMQQYVLVWLFHDLDQILKLLENSKKTFNKKSKSVAREQACFLLIHFCFLTCLVRRSCNDFLKPRHNTIGSNIEFYSTQKFIMDQKPNEEQELKMCGESGKRKLIQSFRTLAGQAVISEVNKINLPAWVPVSRGNCKRTICRIACPSKTKNEKQMQTMQNTHQKTKTPRTNRDCVLAIIHWKKER